MSRRSVRSSPASRISLSEPTGSALVAIAKARSTVTTTLRRMGKASEWLREERRKVLGDWVAFCRRCGAVQRWFEEFEDEVAHACPACGGEMLRRCPSC